VNGLNGELAVQPQRTLDSDLPVAESCVLKNLGLWCFLEIQKSAADALDVFWRKFAILLAEIRAQRLDWVA